MQQMQKGEEQTRRRSDPLRLLRSRLLTVFDLHLVHAQAKHDDRQGMSGPSAAAQAPSIQKEVAVSTAERNKEAQCSDRKEQQAWLLVRLRKVREANERKTLAGMMRKEMCRESYGQKE